MSMRALAAAALATRSADDVVVVRLQGELGNQLFQFALGTALARRLGCPLRFDVEHHEPTVAHCIGDAYVLASDADLLRVGELRTTPIEQLVRSLQLRAWLPVRRRGHRPDRRLVSRDAFRRDPRLDQLVAPCFVRGYFQCLALFAPVLDEVIDRVLIELGELDEWGEPPGAASKEPDVVGVHFRRGDYLPRGWQLTMGYYEAALAHLDQHIGPTTLRVYADDALFGHLMVEHLRGQGRTAELADEPGVHSDPPVDALVDMARCHHLVTANSTFSWWAAVLGDRLHPRRPEHHQRLVLAPERWRQDRPPPDLVRPGWQVVPG